MLTIVRQFIVVLEQQLSAVSTLVLQDPDYFSLLDGSLGQHLVVWEGHSIGVTLVPRRCHTGSSYEPDIMRSGIYQYKLVFCGVKFGRDELSNGNAASTSTDYDDGLLCW